MASAPNEGPDKASARAGPQSIPFASAEAVPNDDPSAQTTSIRRTKGMGVYRSNGAAT